MSQASPGRRYLSWALFALSAALFIAVAVLYLRDRDDKNGEAPPPTSVPGHNQGIHIRQALSAQGLKATFVQGGARSDELSVAGQLMEVEGAQLYYFIYPEGTAQREAETNEIDLSAMTLLTTRGTPVAGGPPHVYAGSNVVVALYNASDEIAEKVKSAIEGLP